MSSSTRPGLKRIVFELLHPADGDAALPTLPERTQERLSAWSARIDLFIMSLIVLSVAGVILESVDSMRSAYGTALHAFEFVAVVVFTVEYVGRIWTCTLAEPYDKSLSGRLKWSMTPLAIIDLLAILPFYLPFLGVDARFLRLFRLMRILRLAKLKRYIYTLRLFGRVWASKRHEIVMTTALMLMLLLISASLMYYAERSYQPDTFGSIPQAMWWAIATLTTVGYGDVTPISGLGRTLAAVVAMLGIGLFALPTSILGSGFVNEIEKDRQASLRGKEDAQEDEPTKVGACTCPHCGETLSVTLQGAGARASSDGETQA